MYSRFPFSMENIPRQTSFGCFSLKVGSIVAALVFILSSILALAQCAAAFTLLPPMDHSDKGLVITYCYIIFVTTVHGVTFMLTSFMLLGVLREKIELIKPWIVWSAVQVMVLILLFIYWSTFNIINHFADNTLMVYVIEFLCLVIRIYLFMVVASYYREIEENSEEEERLKKPINDVSYNA